MRLQVRNLNLQFVKFKNFMNEKTNIPNEIITSNIYFIRDQKVMLDRDLATLYNVETKQLKRQVRRNIDHFPKDFMFELTKEEFENWRSQFGTSNSDKMGLRILPMVFTKQGIAMLSSVLHSKTAIKVNIQIIRIFTKMKSLLLTHKDLIIKLKEVEEKVTSHQIMSFRQSLKERRGISYDKLKISRRSYRHSVEMTFQ